MAGRGRWIACDLVTRALVIGGTGPTGIPLVRGLVARGYDVTIVHRGLHERAETPPEVAHIHIDPYDDDALRELFGGSSIEFDVVVAMYGRLRRIAELTAAKVDHFVSVGGVPAYKGWMNPWLFDPPGLPVPVDEHAPTVTRPEDDEKGYRIVRSEEAVFAHHPRATHFRYPYVYGPHQLVPREWLIVRRILDGRRRMVVADDGLTLHHHGYTENLAHALLLAIEQPDAAAGKIFNVGDEDVLSIRQVIELIAAALGHQLEIISMPYELAVPARPLLAQPLPTHRVLDISRVRTPTSAIATWCRRALRSVRPRAGSSTIRAHPAGRRRWCSPIRSTTQPRIASSTPGSRRPRPCPTPASPSNRATDSRTAVPAGGPAPTRSSTRDTIRSPSPESRSSTCRSRSPGRTRSRCSAIRAPMS